MIEIILTITGAISVLAMVGLLCHCIIKMMKEV